MLTGVFRFIPIMPVTVPKCRQVAFLRITHRLPSIANVATVALAACAILLVQAVEPDSSGLLGKWRLTKVLDSSEIS